MSDPDIVLMLYENTQLWVQLIFPVLAESILGTCVLFGY
jgi:ABC-type uncharacterized transport system permease subunit